jgi:HK97 family phage major capsid protein
MKDIDLLKKDAEGNYSTLTAMLQDAEREEKELKEAIKPITLMLQNDGRLVPRKGKRMEISQVLSSDDAPQLLPVAFDQRIRTAAENLQNLRQYTRVMPVDAVTTYFPKVTAMKRSYIASAEVDPIHYGIKLSTEDVTIQDYEMATGINKNLIKDSNWNMLALILDAVGYAMKIGENIDIMNSYVNGAFFNTPATGGAFDLEDISDMIADIEETQQFMPSTIFVGTEIGSKIRKMSEFQNVAFFGSRDIWVSGKLTNLFGLQLISTPFLDRDALGAKRSTRCVVMYDGNFPAIYAELEPVSVQSEDSLLKNITNTIARERRAVKVIDDKAVGVITDINPANL